MATQTIDTATPPRTGLPRLGFLGVGWIGQHRMRAVAEAGAAEVAAVADPSEAALEAAAAAAPRARQSGSLHELLEEDLNGIVIATPSAMHADQAAAALDRGIAVFCQKPLARTAAETARVVEAARRADRLLGVDLSYRHTEAFRRILAAIDAGELGDIYAADLVFHNAYGPDKPWFKDPALSGGGCVIDLGVHLVDLALLALGRPEITEVSSHLLASGQPLRSAPGQVEDFALAELTTSAGTRIRLACSWWVHAGQEAVIEVTFRGTRGGASLRNVGGSFYDFRADLLSGTSSRSLASPPDAWGGRAIVAWARELARSPEFNAEIQSSVDVARVLDRIYGR